MFKKTAKKARADYDQHKDASEAAASEVEALDKKRRDGLLSDEQFNEMLGSVIDTTDADE